MSASVELGDLQGNILCGYGDDFAQGAHLFCQIRDRKAARNWLGELSARVTSAEPWGATKPPSTLNISISWAGLRELGVPHDDLKRFPKEFKDGMAARADRLKDSGPDAPEEWEQGLNDRDVHLLVSVHVRSDDPEPLRTAIAAVTPPAGVSLLQTQETRRLEGGREHYGFSDGLAQPAIDDNVAGPWHGHGTPERRPGNVHGWKDLAPGEFLLGYLDEDEEIPTAPAPFDRNASYMVVRKLQQDVAAWHDQLRRWAADNPTSPDLLGAQIVGRWQNGTPLVSSPDGPDPFLDHPELAVTEQDRKRRFERLNDFRFGDDPKGLRCPAGSHIRRANPRDALGDGRLARRHRIIRRGMPYGDPPKDPLTPDERERGLFFVCFQASIARQFELIQGDWLQDGDAFGLGADRDVLLSPGADGGKLMVGGRPPRFFNPHARTITLKGGGYFLTPSISSLKAFNKG